MNQPNLCGLDAMQIWNTELAFAHLQSIGQAHTKRTAERRLHALALLPAPVFATDLHDELGRKPTVAVLSQQQAQARSKRKLVLFAQLHALPGGRACLHANDARGTRYWAPLNKSATTPQHIAHALLQLQAHIGKALLVFPHNDLARLCRQAAPVFIPGISLLAYPPVLDLGQQTRCAPANNTRLPHLKRLESESIHAIREAIAEAQNPAMRYSAGKRSTVMLRLAHKAFYPAPPPLALLQENPGGELQEACQFREHIARACGLQQAQDPAPFDVVLGTEPLAQWTDLDLWHYIHQENLAVLPLYLAKERPVVVRKGTMMLVPDDNFPLLPGEVIHARKVRICRLGAYPLTGVVASESAHIEDVIQELATAPQSLPSPSRPPAEMATVSQKLVFPIQWVNRVDSTFTGYSGSVAQGSVQVGDQVRVTLSGQTAKVTGIITQDGPLAQADAGQAVTLVLERDIAAARGDILSLSHQPLDSTDQFEATLVWVDADPGLVGRSYRLKLATQWATASITSIKHTVNATTLAHEASKTLVLHDTGVCNIATSKPLVFDSYPNSPTLGSFILVDRVTHATVATGKITHSLRRAQNLHQQALTITRSERETLNGHKGRVIWFTGLSGSGKSTIANALEVALHAQGRRTYLLDGDNVRQGLNRDLGFTDADRVENIRRIAEVAKLMMDAGMIVMTAFISPFRREREMARELIGPENFVEVYVSTPLEVCEERDPKGLYKKARSGQLPNMTGIASPYERPDCAALVVSGQNMVMNDTTLSIMEIIFK